MSVNEEFRKLLESTDLERLDKVQKRQLSRAVRFYQNLDDIVLAEVARMAFCACAWRLAANREQVDILTPTQEVFKQALDDTFKLLKKSVDDDF